MPSFGKRGKMIWTGFLNAHNVETQSPGVSETNSHTFCCFFFHRIAAFLYFDCLLDSLSRFHFGGICCFFAVFSRAVFFFRK